MTKKLTDLAREIMTGKTLSEGNDPLKNVNDLGPAIVHPLQARGKNYGSGIGGSDDTIPGSNGAKEKFNPTNKKTEAPGDVQSKHADSKDKSIPGSDKAGEKFDPTNNGKAPDLSGNPADGPAGGKGKGEPYNPTNRTQSVKEEVLSEISKKTLGSYIVKAGVSIKNAGKGMGKAKSDKDFSKHENDWSKRQKGINKAVSRLTKEDVEAIEEFLGGEITEEALNALSEDQTIELLNFLDPEGSLLEAKDDDDDDSKEDKSDKDDSDDDSDDDEDDKDSDEDKKAKFEKFKKESKELADKAIKEHVDAMLSGENLTEEFQKKATTIFEAAVAEREAVLREEIQAEYASKLEEAVVEIKTELEGKVDDYMSYVAKNWLDENEVAIESGLKVSLSDDFLNGLRNLFIEHHIDIPTEKVDVVEELSGEVEDLEAKLNEEIEKNVEAQKQISMFVRRELVSEACVDLTAIQASKLVKLAEGITADSDEDFASKLSVIRESYTGIKAPLGKDVTEDKDPSSNEKKENLSEDNPMARYVAVARKRSPWQQK